MAEIVSSSGGNSNSYSRDSDSVGSIPPTPTAHLGRRCTRPIARSSARIRIRELAYGKDPFGRSVFQVFRALWFLFFLFPWSPLSSLGRLHSLNLFPTRSAPSNLIRSAPWHRRSRMPDGNGSRRSRSDREGRLRNQFLPRCTFARHRFQKKQLGVPLLSTGN